MRYTKENKSEMCQWLCEMSTVHNATLTEMKPVIWSLCWAHEILARYDLGQLHWEKTHGDESRQGDAMSSRIVMAALYSFFPKLQVTIGRVFEGVYPSSPRSWLALAHQPLACVISALFFLVKPFDIAETRRGSCWKSATHELWYLLR
jgi:hypothetical protein